MATTPSKVTIIFVRGLFGWIYSRGMDTLAGKFRARGYNTQVWNHSTLFITFFGNTNAIIAEVRRLSNAGQTVFLVGHSFGGNTILRVARGLGLKVKALFAVDPAQQYDCSVPANVELAFGFRNDVGGLGRGRLTPQRPGIVDIPLSDNHVYIDDDPRVHNRIIAEIAKL
jgi:pimeloyl-ACP methyl ester carboxylesterase